MKNPLPPRYRRWWSRFFGSRKWLLTIAVVPLAIHAGEWERATAIVTAYLAVQGGSDLLARWKYGNSDALTPTPGSDSDQPGE